jgi:hypothetical protein
MAVSLDGLSARVVGDVGQVSVASGTKAQNLRLDRQAGLLTSGLHGHFTEQALNENIFCVSSQAAVATTAALAGTWTGLCVTNPAASRYNMAILEFGGSLSVAGSDDGSMGLLGCTIAAPASNVTIKNMKMGGRSSIGIADDGATIVGGYVIGAPFAYGTGATNLVNQTGTFVWNLDGKLIVPPGYTVATYTTTATTAAFIFYFIWEEIPI